MALAEETAAERRSLEEVHGSVEVPAGSGRAQRLRRLFAFLGPAYLVSVGYMDPGNWATDLEGGRRFGYALIWVLLDVEPDGRALADLAARLGVVTGHDLAQACRAEYSRGLNAVLWVLAEVAIAATDLAEILGTIIALKLLFGLPLLWGCLITAFDTFVLLYLQRWGMRQMEAVILALVATIGGCFLIQIFLARPDMGGVLSGSAAQLAARGLVRGDRHPGRDGHAAQPLLALGAGADPSDRRRRPEQVRSACRYYLIDAAIAFNAGVFRQRGDSGPERGGFSPARIGRRHHRRSVQAACRHSSVRERRSCSPSRSCAPARARPLTGTLAGQIVMEGYLHLRLAPWLRRLITRLHRPCPGRGGHFAGGRTGDPAPLDPQPGDPQLATFVRGDSADPLHVRIARTWGHFATPWWGQVLAWSAAAVIVALNGKLVLDQVGEWVSWAARVDDVDRSAAR